MRPLFILAVAMIVIAAPATAQRYYAGPVVAWPDLGVTLRRPLFFVDERSGEDDTQLARWRGAGGGKQRDWYVTVRTQPGDATLDATRARWLPALTVENRTLVDHGTLTIGPHRWLFFESRAGSDGPVPVAFTALAALPGSRLVEIRVETTRATPVATCRRFALDLLTDVRPGGVEAGLPTWLAPAPVAVCFPDGWSVETHGATHRATAPDGSTVEADVLVEAGSVADAVCARGGDALIVPPESLDVPGGKDGVVATIAEHDALAGVRIGEAIVVVRATARARRAEPIAVALVRSAVAFDADEERRALARARIAFDRALDAKPFDGAAALEALAAIDGRLDVPGADVIVRRALAAQPLVAEAIARTLARRPSKAAFTELKRAVPTLVRRKRPATLAAVLRAVAASRHPQAPKVLVRQLEHPHAAVVFAAIEGLGPSGARPVKTFAVVASFWAALEKTAASRPQMKRAIGYEPIRRQARELLAAWASTSFDKPDEARAWFTANRRKLR